jgi:hypothetical protein
MMKAGHKSLAVLLAVLGIGDLVMVPFMIQANHQHAGTPPMPAIVVSAVLGVATLATIHGAIQGRRWAFWVQVICRVVDMVSAVLGIFGGPDLTFGITGAIGLALSAAAVVLLVRLNPRRAVRAASSA